MIVLPSSIPRLRAMAVPSFLMLALSTSCWAATLDGFITKVDSATEFHINALHVRADGKTLCYRERRTSYIGIRKGNYFFGLRSENTGKSKLATPCERLPLRVGSYVRVAGNNGQDGSFIAAQITAYIITVREDFASYGWSDHWLAGGALIEEEPHIGRTASGWTGSLWLDGYPMRIGSHTKVLTAPDGTRMGYGFFSMFQTAPHVGAIMPKDPAPVPSPSLFEPDTWAAYQGTGPPEKQHELNRIRLWPDQSTREEKLFQKQLALRIQPPNYSRGIAGTLSFERRRGKATLEILPSRSIQRFISQVGTSLIPAYQTRLRNQKQIHFRFYAIRTDGKFLDDESRPLDGVGLLAEPTENDIAGVFPDGVIVIPDYTLARLRNQAQLASVLSCAITVVLQKHDYPTPTTHGWDTFYASLGSSIQDYYAGLTSSTPNLDGFLFPLITDEQMLRIGIRQMYLAGYDIREAPFALAAAEGKPVTNPILYTGELHQSKQDIPWYTAYAFHYISQYYGNVDYTKLKRGRTSYAAFLNELREADPSAFATGEMARGIRTGR